VERRAIASSSADKQQDNKCCTYFAAVNYAATRSRRQWRCASCEIFQRSARIDGPGLKAQE
jgi:hypothetical protein